ncbi:uncharacterized protein LOC128546475 [Mercenaria mercenaria]|uniref:uncharacterized protein LOC128546475 n=1 Tax=Mercenaria mercenaria TaxID=6596 RepID=UPI00234F62EA|nr:uncharacterized protein LOC128546475 [Mercenaria mercenaria]
MFDDVLEEARGDLAGNDLGRVVIHHQGLHDPIVVPLQPWDQLNADRVMETIEKVLNSNKDLCIDESFDISVGSIDLPKGSGGPRRRITKLKGKNNSLQLKTSIVTIENDDQMCIARAIGVSWAKLNRCTSEEWKEITKNRQKKSNLQLILENQKVPESYYKKLREKKRDEQRQLAAAISQLAQIPMDRPASLEDITAFEEVLGVRVIVISAMLGPYPEAKFYGHDFMSEKERSDLLAWLSEKKNDVFDFRKEMLEYCRSDVDILRQACLKFRELLMNATDSVIYVSRPGQYDPPLGDYLGELTDELDGGEYIVEFVSGGPKNYAYKTSKNKETCKLRTLLRVRLNIKSRKHSIEIEETTQSLPVFDPTTGKAVNALQSQKDVERLKAGKFKYILSHPEQLIKPEVKRLLMSHPLANRITNIVVDEAHCILSWGASEFRPAYKKLGMLRAVVPNANILALTATATLKGQEKIISSLHMHNTKVISASPDR